MRDTPEQLDWIRLVPPREEGRVPVEEPSLPRSAHRLAVLGVLENQQMRIELLPSHERMLATLRGRFEDPESVVDQTELLWSEVEAALRADPESLEKAMRLEASGGVPNLFREVDGHFEFADCFRRPPEVRKGLSYEKAKELADAWGITLMDEKTYLDFLSRAGVDKYTTTLLFTPDEMLERKGHAKLGKRLYGRPIVTSIPAKNPGEKTAFRCVFRVKKV